MQEEEEEEEGAVRILMGGFNKKGAAGRSWFLLRLFNSSFNFSFCSLSFGEDSAEGSHILRISYKGFKLIRQGYHWLMLIDQELRSLLNQNQSSQQSPSWVQSEERSQPDPPPFLQAPRDLSAPVAISFSSLS